MKTLETGLELTPGWLGFKPGWNVQKRKQSQMLGLSFLTTSNFPTLAGEISQSHAALVDGNYEG